MRFNRLEQRGARRVGDRLEMKLDLPKAPNGMTARLCPKTECAPRLFQLGEVARAVDADVAATPSRRVPHGDGTTCPYCGHDSDDDQDFVDPRDAEALTEWFKWAALEDMKDAFAGMLDGVARRLPRGGPISISMTTNRSHAPEPRIWREDLLRDLTCSACGRRYGVYAIGLFCPDCGRPNLAVHFHRECELVEQQIDLARSQSAELGFRLLGNAHEDVVTALETYQKTVFRYLVRQRFTGHDAQRLSSPSGIGNAFQNIEKARERFAKVGVDPFVTLESLELEQLRLNIEKRHVLGHNLGLSDERYAEVATGEQPGTTVVLLSGEVSRFAALAAKVVSALELQAFPGPAST